VERIAPLKPGDAAAIAVERADDEDELVLLAQCALADPGQREALAAQLRAAINRATGASARIVLVPPRSLPHTSSGKLARARAKAHYLAGDYPA
jgi:fatty-acyl-CoA synthase